MRRILFFGLASGSDCDTALDCWCYVGHRGARAASGMPLKFQLTRATRPWIELLNNGTFGKATLGDLAPTSFMIDPRWVELLEKSVAKHGATWLHSLYLGTAALEMGNSHAAAVYFNQSLTMQPSVHAERALGIFAANAAESAAHYTAAWKHWKELLATTEADEMPATMPIHVLELGRELATEYAAWLAGGTVPQYDELKGFLMTEKASLERVMKLKRNGGRETDDFMFAR